MPCLSTPQTLVMLLNTRMSSLGRFFASYHELYHSENIGVNTSAIPLVATRASSKRRQKRRRVRAVGDGVLLQHLISNLKLISRTTIDRESSLTAVKWCLVQTPPISIYLSHRCKPRTPRERERERDGDGRGGCICGGHMSSISTDDACYNRSALFFCLLRLLPHSESSLPAFNPKTDYSRKNEILLIDNLMARVYQTIRHIFCNKTGIFRPTGVKELRHSANIFDGNVLLLYRRTRQLRTSNATVGGTMVPHFKRSSR